MKTLLFFLSFFISLTLSAQTQRESITLKLDTVQFADGTKQTTAGMTLNNNIFHYNTTYKYYEPWALKSSVGSNAWFYNEEVAPTGTDILSLNGFLNTKNFFYYNQNIGIGNLSFNQYTGASSGNNGFGDWTLHNITTGNGNNAFGISSLASVTTGSQNIGIGQGSLGILTTGNNNVSIGGAAGSSNITGSGNVFVGYKAGYYETGSNKLYISNSNVSTPLILGDFIANTLTLGNHWNLKTDGSTSIPLGTTYQVNDVPINLMVRDSMRSNTAYGEHHLLVGGLETISTPTISTNYNVTQYTATDVLKDVTNATNGGLQVSTKGTYLITFTVRIVTGHLNAVGISVNGTRNLDSEVDVFSYSGFVTGSKIVNLRANDIVRMTVTTDNTSQVDITLKSSNLALSKIIN